MKMDKSQVRSIIGDELDRIIEACGCGGVPETDDENKGESITRAEALGLVSMIAKRTSCPVTQKALLDVVESLSDEIGEVAGLSSSDSFGAGYSQGSEDREKFSYSGDLPGDSKDSGRLGYRAGVMGLG